MVLVNGLTVTDPDILGSALTGIPPLPGIAVMVTLVDSKQPPPKSTSEGSALRKIHSPSKHMAPTGQSLSELQLVLGDIPPSGSEQKLADRLTPERFHESNTSSPEQIKFGMADNSGGGNDGDRVLVPDLSIVHDDNKSAVTHNTTRYSTRYFFRMAIDLILKFADLYIGHFMAKYI